MQDRFSDSTTVSICGRCFSFILVLCITLILYVPLLAQTAGQGLVVHPENPYFLFYQGRFIFSWANNGHGVNAGQLGQYKINHYEIYHRWFDGSAPCLSGDRFPGSGNTAFSDSYFSALKSELSKAKQQGICVSIVLFSLTAFEGDRTPGSRFGGNAWNACLGGPIDIGSCAYQDRGEKSNGATSQFLTLESYDYSDPITDKYSSYSSDWALSRKVQYRTEEIIAKFVNELRDYDNWFFNMLWEINDNPGSSLTKEWAKWFAGYVKNLDQKRLVFTGEEEGADYASSASTVDGSCHEGNVLGGDLSGSISRIRSLGQESNRKPKLVIGYDPFDSGGRRRDHLYNTNPQDFSADRTIEYMRASLLAGNGVHPGTPFHSKYYNMDKVLRWVQACQNLLSTVDSWHNEPGDEIRDSTVPGVNDFNFVDLPDGDGRVGWPKDSYQVDVQAPAAPRGIVISRESDN